MVNHLLVLGPVPGRIRVVENEHETPAIRSVRRRSKHRVVRNTHIRPGLHVADNAVAPQSATTKVVLLVISRRLSEAHLVEPVVVEVAVVKKLDG